MAPDLRALVGMSFLVGLVASIDYYATPYAVLAHPLPILLSAFVVKKYELPPRVVYLTSSIAVGSILIVGLLKPAEQAWSVRDFGFVACVALVPICLWWVRKNSQNS